MSAVERNSAGRQRGFVALAVIAGLVIVAAIAMLLVTESTMESDRAGRGIESLQAEYAALAAIEHAEWQADQGSCENYALPTTAFGTHSYTASFSPTSGSPTTIDATATMTSGIQRSMSRPATRAYQPTNTPVVLQPDPTSGSDTYVYEWKSTWNYGTSPRIWADYRFNDSQAHALIKFDLGSIPFGARISSAVLELYSENPSLDGGAISVHRVTQPWIEGDEAGGLGAGATWTVSGDGASNWTTAGGDYELLPEATTTVPAGIGWSSWDIASLVAGWVAGEFSNDGLLLRPAASGTSSTAAHFASSDNSTAALRPKLTIEYSCECGITCAASQTSGEVVMIVGDDSVPTPGDLAKQALMESWGYTVRLEGDNISAGGISSLMDTRDVLFVADSVDPTRVETKLTGLAKGVVSEVGALNGDLGFASGAAWTTGDTITIAENDHYITQPFDLGDLRIYDAAMEGVTVAGTPSPSLEALGQWSSATGLATLDAGAQTASGGTAAGRRALLPFGRNINLAFLNNNGRLIMQRALEWASAPAGTTSNALMVVADAANPSAQEIARQVLLGSFGYAVTLIDDGDSQANFDAAIAANDVAYVPEDITSSTLGTKLRDATIGVVIEDKESMVVF
ncbi:MAG: DNRLRE domain-containing protein, partial [Gammaproteobacteria bacterium]|nr:DNRLRE domain-containing protein [Gammaproteobacteria bacterium]